MALTPQELEQWVSSKIDTSVEPNWADQNDISQYRGIGIKYDKQLQDLDTLYSSKINRLIAIYERDLTEFSSYIKNFNIAPIELKGGLGGLSDKILRLGEKWLATKREIEGRTKGYFTRNPVGTVYYIDLDNGSDASPHDGLKVGNYTADAGTGTTTLVETSELGRTTDDDWNGAYLYNVTRGIGVQITDSAYVAGTWTLTHPTITGQVSGDTYFIIDAWKTVEQYTTVTGRSVGDIGYVRANTSEVHAGVTDILFDEDGDKDNRISIIGCDSVVNDLWFDGSDVKPIIDFNAGDFKLQLGADFYWFFEKLHIRNNIAADAIFYINSTYGTVIDDCIVEDNSVGGGVLIRQSAGVLVQDTILRNTTTRNIVIGYVVGSEVRILGCTIDGGVNNPGYGLYSERPSIIEVIDTEFGQNVAHGIRDIHIQSSSTKIFMRNVKWDKSSGSIVSAESNITAVISSEDDDQVKGSQLFMSQAGKITKDTGVIRSGGAVSSAKFEPIVDCSVYVPLCFHPNSSIFVDYKVWCKGGAERTITIYIRSFGVWSVYPTASELYVEASYLDHATNASRAIIVSNDVLDDETTWRAFDVTFTPQQEGFVYLNVYLKKYEASKGCYVDIKPVVS